IKTLPAVQSTVPEHDLPFPFSVRRALGLWKLMFFDDKPFAADPGKSAEWNRGAYLVNGPGHCAECHSPRNALGGVIASHRSGGAPTPPGKVFTQNPPKRGPGNYPKKTSPSVWETATPPGGVGGGAKGAEGGPPPAHPPGGAPTPPPP